MLGRSDVLVAVLLAAIAGALVLVLRDRGWWLQAAAGWSPWVLDAALGAIVALLAGLAWCVYRGGVKARREIQGLWAAERALIDAKDDAERAHAVKCRGLAAASHDLRQPLHGLRLLLAALGRAQDERQRDEIMSAINAGFDSIGRLLNTLLDLSELEAGTIEPRVERFAVGDLLYRVSASFAPRAAEQGLRYRVVGSSAVVVSDPDLLARIVENLLANAVDHNGEGGAILLGCRRRGRMLRIEVRDSGRGIPEAQQGEIFKEFHRLDGRLDGRGGRRVRGLGLGLAIVDQLARLLDHRIEVVSAPGRGSTFAVEVPLAERQSGVAASPAVVAADGPSLAGRSVFVIDDDFGVLDATRHLLEGWGAEVTTVVGNPAVPGGSDGTASVPDLIIADVDTCGAYQLARLRARHVPAVPALLLTSRSAADFAGGSVLGGMPLLRKPVDPAQLSAEIGKMLAGPSAARP